MVVHTNRWPWGISRIIVLDKGNALCKLTIDDADNTEAWLCDVVVISKMRRRGLGRALLQEAIKQAKEMGAKTMKLETLTGSWMVGWYKRNGFEFVENSQDGNPIFKKIL